MSLKFIGASNERSVVLEYFRFHGPSGRKGQSLFALTTYLYCQFV